MSDTARRPTVLLSDSWSKKGSELGFVTRSLAGMASRLGGVTVLHPGAAGVVTADGAFDTVGVGEGDSGMWPDAAAVTWPHDLPDGANVLLDRLDDTLHPLLARFSSASSVRAVAPTDGSLPSMSLLPGPSEFVGIHVPINPLAGQHRHNGLGFTGYLLILTERPGTPEPDPPTAAVAWITAAFHDLYVVVVEGATASAWKGRSLRGTVPVDSRMDLWRLLAHASVTVDLAPGPVIARECIESLRFATPIVVSEGSSAAVHARAGGMTYADVDELFECITRSLDTAALAELAKTGSHYADQYYGDAAHAIESLSEVLR